MELEGVSCVFKVQSYVTEDNIIPCGPFPIDDPTLLRNASFSQFLFHMWVSLMGSSIILFFLRAEEIRLLLLE